MSSRGRLVGLATALGVALVVLAGSAGGASASAIVRVVDIGEGGGEAWVYLPEQRPSCVVAFVHDRGDLTPRRYAAWLDYLVLGKHCAVVFPHYETAAGGGMTSATALRHLHAGLARGLAYLRNATFGLGTGRMPAHPPVVAAGVGYGGTLAVAYAAEARAWGLPTPRAVDAIFPVATAADTPRARLPAAVRVLIQVGDRDRVGGQAAAGYLWRYLVPHPAAEKRLQIVRSRGRLAAVHGAPLQTTAAAVTAFWMPLDGLIDAATG